MKKAEALKLAIDGKKVRSNLWTDAWFITFDCDRGCFVWNINQAQYNGGDESLSSEGWEGEGVKDLQVWSSTITYHKGNKVIYKSRMFECIANKFVPCTGQYDCMATIGITPAQLPFEWKELPIEN